MLPLIYQVAKIQEDSAINTNAATGTTLQTPKKEVTKYNAEKMTLDAPTKDGYKAEQKLAKVNNKTKDYPNAATKTIVRPLRTEEC